MLQYKATTVQSQDLRELQRGLLHQRLLTAKSNNLCVLEYCCGGSLLIVKESWICL